MPHTPEMPEIVKQRDQFFGRVSLAESYVFCSDDRTPDVTIKWFGGILNPVYNLTVLKEVVEPGSVVDTFEDETQRLVPLVRESAGVKPGVHSDSYAEGGDHMHTDKDEGPVGCGYAELRQAISAKISAERDEIISDAKTLRPELFQTEEADGFATRVADAHQRLADRDGFFTSGRKVVLRAIDEGAEVIVVGGPHLAEEGIINLDPNTSLDSGAAMAAGLPAYNHDAWASQEAYDKIRINYPYQRYEQQIAELVDAIGTMRALNVKDIAVRYPQSAVPRAA